jgi:hypothetical protein
MVFHAFLHAETFVRRLQDLTLAALVITSGIIQNFTAISYAEGVFRSHTWVTETLDMDWSGHYAGVKCHERFSGS